ncbi:hypothetical protein JCM14036_18630 [Desulfotomaculum defluvii]
MTHQLVSETTEMDLYEGTRHWLERDDSVVARKFAMTLICISILYLTGQVLRFLFN